MNETNAIEAVRSGEGWVVELPARRHPARRRGGMFMVVMGLAPLVLTPIPLWLTFDAADSIGWLIPAFILAGALPVILVFLALAGLGWWLARGRVLIRVRPGWMEVTERAWPIRWTRERRIDQTSALSVQQRRDAENCWLRLEGPGGRYEFAFGYPREVLEAACAELVKAEPRLGAE